MLHQEPNVSHSSSERKLEGFGCRVNWQWHGIPSNRGETPNQMIAYSGLHPVDFGWGSG